MLAFTPNPGPLPLAYIHSWWCVRVYRRGALLTHTFVQGRDADDACDRAAWCLGAHTCDRYQAEPEPIV